MPDEDPHQLVNLWRSQPELALRLNETLFEHVEAATNAREFGTVAADGDTLRMLQDVGYVGDEAAPAPPGTSFAPRPVPD